MTTPQRTSAASTMTATYRQRGLCSSLGLTRDQIAQVPPTYTNTFTRDQTGRLVRGHLNEAKLRPESERCPQPSRRTVSDVSRENAEKARLARLARQAASPSKPVKGSQSSLSSSGTLSTSTSTAGMCAARLNPRSEVDTNCASTPSQANPTYLPPGYLGHVQGAAFVIGKSFGASTRELLSTSSTAPLHPSSATSSYSSSSTR